MKKPILNCRALVLIATIATFPAMSVPARAAVPDMAASAVAFMPSDVDKFIDTLPLPSPRELPELARKLGKLIGKALGLEFALKLGACAVAADNVQEFRTCVRGLVLGTQS